MEVFRPATSSLVDPEQILQGTGDEEELLLEPQNFSLDQLIVRIEDLRDVLRTHFLFDRTIIVALIVGGEIEGLDRLSLPESKQIRCTDAITQDRSVVRFPFDNVVRHPFRYVIALAISRVLGVTSKLHIVVEFRANNFPWITISEPFVGSLRLPAIPDRLLKYPEFVPNAVADRRDL